jgi:hypothetical protein
MLVESGVSLRAMCFLQVDRKLDFQRMLIKKLKVNLILNLSGL